MTRSEVCFLSGSSTQSLNPAPFRIFLTPTPDLSSKPNNFLTICPSVSNQLLLPPPPFRLAHKTTIIQTPNIFFKFSLDFYCDSLVSYLLIFCIIFCFVFQIFIRFFYFFLSMLLQRLNFYSQRHEAKSGRDGDEHGIISNYSNV